MSGKDLIAQQKHAITADSLYGSEDDQAALYKAVSKFAPWVKGKVPMSPEEVMLVVRRVTSQGLDPLNPHEVQIWKDHHGVQTQPAYTLMIEWVKHFKGNYTEPQYERLSDRELAEEGLEENDVAYQVRFLMRDDIGTLTELIKAGYQPKEARSMLEVTGLGVATRDEYDGKYFAPKGRSKSWKVKKRAMTDAIRRKFGTPTRAEIVELRRLRGDANLTLDDWAVVDPEMDDEQQLQLARAAAQSRTWEEEFEDLSDEEKQERFEHAKRLLEGDPNDSEGFEAAATDEDATNQPSPEPDNIIDAVIEEDPFSALLAGQPDVYGAARYTTPKGEQLGRIELRRLTSMLDYLLNLENPGEDAKALQSHVEVCIEYLQGFEGNPSIAGTLDEWGADRPIDPAETIKALRRASGWTENDDETWERGEAGEPEKKRMQQAAAIIGSACGGDDSKRHDLLAVIYGQTSTKGLNATEVEGIINRWARKDEAWKANNQGFFEAHAILDANSLPGIFADTI